MRLLNPTSTAERTLLLTPINRNCYRTIIYTPQLPPPPSSTNISAKIMEIGRSQCEPHFAAFPSPSSLACAPNPQSYFFLLGILAVYVLKRPESTTTMPINLLLGFLQDVDVKKYRALCRTANATRASL